MPDDFFYKVQRKLLRLLFFILFQYPRVLKYKIISTARQVQGKPKINQPVVFEGQGEIIFSSRVNLGVVQSPSFYSGYIYIDARHKSSRIVFGSDVWVNNNCVFISEGEGIYIGDDTLIGTNCEFVDSDFHDLDPDKRMGGNIKTGKISIGRNVFIGSNVKVLKGVTIGDNTVIANSAVVTKSIPENVIAGGVPARVIKEV